MAAGASFTGRVEDLGIALNMGVPRTEFPRDVAD